MDRCLDDDEVAAFVDGAVDGALRQRIEAHIDRCPACRMHVVAMLQLEGSAARPATPGPLALASAGPGSHVGRYALVRRLGAGAMGVVWLATDPRLQRPVALKLSRHAIVDTDAIVREGRALARLSDPRIVEIYDVGHDVAGAYLAMRYVDGLPLDRWAAQRRPDWREIVRVCLDAGHGLAAAHRAGVLHRDVKPSNIMVSAAGEAFVADFGLSRLREATAPSPASAGWQAAGASHPADGATLPDARGVVGTPRYMAPEQHRGETIEASDQYAFCATMFEALHGRPPFAGEDLAGLLQAKLRGPERAHGRDEVPVWLDAVIARGLAPRPADRWASIDALLRALSRARSRRQPWPLLAAALALALPLGAFAWPQSDDASARAQRCDAAGGGLAAVWNDRVRGAVRAAVLETGALDAGASAAAIERWLDLHAQRWSDAHAEICAHVRSDPVWDDALLDRANACLTDRVDRVVMLLDELRGLDAAGVARAVGAAGRLPDAAPCAAAGWLARGLPPPTAEQRERIVALATRLFRARVVEYVESDDDALAELQTIAGEAAAERWPPLVHAARAAEAALRFQRGESERSEQLAVDAYYGATSVGDWDTAAEAATLLVRVVGSAQARHADGLEWARHAEAALTQAGAAGGIAAAKLARDTAYVAHEAGDLELARRRYGEALAIEEQWLPPHHPELGLSRNDLAILEVGAGDLEAARRLLQRVIAADEGGDDEHRPELGVALANLASVDILTGHPARASEMMKRALGIAERLHGPDDPGVMAPLQNLATLYYELSRYDEAIALYERALAMAERSRGPEHPSTANVLLNLAGAELSVDDRAAALRLRERALAILEASLPADHPRVAMTLHGLAHVHLALGHYDRARPLFERALAINTAVLAADHPSLGLALHGLGALYLAERNPQAAEPLLARAVAVMDKTRAPGDRAAARVLVDHARARQALGDLDGAQRMLERALALREAAAPDQPDVAATLTHLSELHLRRGDVVLARALAERAVALFALHPLAGASPPAAWFQLAQTLGRDERGRARSLAQQALARWRSRGDVNEPEVAKAEQWLQRHGGLPR
ncbi:MAG: tetratricopeptide repeat protein [Nannocystaceae bacterium]|nr:tetratricopeptide repeat protein [Nannocystaceae bacterium]